MECLECMFEELKTHGMKQEQAINALISSTERLHYLLTSQGEGWVNPKPERVNPWGHILNMNRKIQTEKEFIGLIGMALNRPSSYLIEGRQISELKEFATNLGGGAETLAVTLTLQKHIQANYEDETIRDMFSDALNFFPSNGYIFYPDIDANGNRHYHGMISMRIKDFFQLKRYLNNNVGWVKKEYISDPNGWYKYMRKDVGFTSKEHPIPLKHPIYNDTEIEHLCLYSNHTLFL